MPVKPLFDFEQGSNITFMTDRARLLSLSVLVILTFESVTASSSGDERAVHAAPAPAQRLHELFDRSWAALMLDYPEWATYSGYPKHNGRWTDLSRKAIEERGKRLKQFLHQIESIDPTKLPFEDRLNYDLFKHDLARDVAENRLPEEYLQINQLDGIQTAIESLFDMMPTTTVDQYNDILSRIEALSAHVDQLIALLREGVRTGITPPRVTMAGVPAQLQSLTDGSRMTDFAASPFLKPFNAFPTTIDDATRAKLRAKALESTERRALPALSKLREFLVSYYIPRCRETIALSALPDGTVWYKLKVRRYTTTEFTPEQIHQLGLSEVQRIRTAMRQTMQDSEFGGPFEAFLEFLGTDSRFFYDDPEELLRDYRDIAKRIDPLLPKLFGSLPRLTYGVQAIPASTAASQPTAYYLPGAPNTGRPGMFMANTHDLKARPKWEMQALTLHEAVPGHHLQISLSREMTGVPEFRKHSDQTAFVEGWGLYAESLGSELGLYKDPYSRFGQLAFEMWRAIRLTVDTGIHSMGWTRQQAIDFFKRNSSKPESDIAVEVDRYIAWPGQALAYKIGQLKIRELRTRAETVLGSRFDVRRFHDAVLRNGALPLTMLESQIDRWISSEKTKP